MIFKNDILLSERILNFILKTYITRLYIEKVYIFLTIKRLWVKGISKLCQRIQADGNHIYTSVLAILQFINKINNKNIEKLNV